MIDVINLSKDYKIHGKTYSVLCDVSMHIDEFEKVAIVGKSGSGKTTLLNIVSGLLKETEGDVMIGDASICKMSGKERSKFRKNNIGMVLQDSLLLHELNAYQNIEIPLKIRKYSKSDRAQKIEEIMEELDIIELKNKYPRQLSGGEKQRIAIARALVYKPKILLMDEPTGSLDGENVENIRSILNKLRATVLLVTHDNGVAEGCDSIYEIKGGSLTRVRMKNVKKQEK